MTPKEYQSQRKRGIRGGSKQKRKNDKRNSTYEHYLLPRHQENHAVTMNIIYFRDDYYRADHVAAIRVVDERVLIQLAFESKPIEYDYGSEELALKAAREFAREWVETLGG